MFSIEKFTSDVANKVSLELELDNNRKEVIEYGIFAILQTALAIGLVLLFGAIFGVFIEAMIISFSASILRKYSGGVHASSPGICALAGAIIMTTLAVLISMIVPLSNLLVVILLGILSFIYSFYLIYRLAPVDSPAKPIKTEKKKERMKKGSILILSVYMLISVASIIIYISTNEEIFFTIVFSIYAGTVWQVFTLTKTGHFIFGKIDTFFNHILTYIGGGK